MTLSDLIGQLTQKEPLNPYQIKGLTAVLRAREIEARDGAVIRLNAPETVLMVLDRTGEQAAPFLVHASQNGAEVVVYPRFDRESLENLVLLTSFAGRKEAIRENLVPVLYEIPNWSDLVTVLSRYAMERDEESLAGHVPEIMDVILSFLFAAAAQPFDSDARAEAEHALCRLTENILRTTPQDALHAYLPDLQKSLDFVATELFSDTINPFRRRAALVTGIAAALNKKDEHTEATLHSSLVRLSAQAAATALGEMKACPAPLVDKLENTLDSAESVTEERFRAEVLEPIKRHSQQALDEAIERYRRAVHDPETLPDPDFKTAVRYIRDLEEDWKTILVSFRQMIEDLPPDLRHVMSEIIVAQILETRDPELHDLFTKGLCDVIVSLETGRKLSSRDLVNWAAETLLSRAVETEDIAESVACLKAVEAIGITLGRRGYFLVSRDLVEHLVARCLIPPKEKRWSVEDDDTGEPLVVAEETGLSQAHVRHIKTILAVIAANPRVMLRLVPYLVVQSEIGGTRLCDEDLIQYWISALIRANSPLTHFFIRTLIKAIPYSFKDIGPLDNLRLTAAGLAKELANRGVKPVGNFLGKLRGDIHWRGSIENFYFAQGIVRYFATGDREEIAEWMPKESLQYLEMLRWCSPEEAEAIRRLTGRIFRDYGIALSEKDGMPALLSADTDRYRSDDSAPAFSRRVVLDMIELVKGLHAKYFITIGETAEASLQEDLDRLERLVRERADIKDTYLTPDDSSPLPPPKVLTEGTDDHVREMERLSEEHPETPIVLRAKKAGHAYAQRASYIEERFEALTKDLSLESVQETLAAGISNTHLDVITSDNLSDALRFLDLLIEGLAVNGHSSYYLECTGKDLLNAGTLGLTYDKVRDLLKVIKKELDDIYFFYRSWFEEHFDRRLTMCPTDRLPRKLKDLTTLREIPDTDFHRNYLKTLYLSDLQARDGNLRVLETFTEKVELFLNQRLSDSEKEVVPVETNPRSHVPFYFPDMGELSPCRVGLKAALLRFAENTPPYFVITTDQPLTDLETMAADHHFRDGLAAAITRLESAVGRSFGDPYSPLLFSVRSGARLSMPGMMTTITNVGINDKIASALAESIGPWFAYDCYRRFLQEYGQAICGVDREDFQDIIDERKNRWRVKLKANLSGDQMRTLALDYKQRVAEVAPEAVARIDEGCFLDVMIRCAVVVLKSYDSPAAQKYRRAAGIDGNWKTPVIVQEMVYGNLDPAHSGTGVASYNPFTLDLRGEFAQGDQGADVVGGKVMTLPIYDLRKERECLASHLPASWKQLSSIIYRTAERLHFDVSLEYTIERGEVFILQVRKNRERKERTPSLESCAYHVIGRGTGVSGNIFRGIMVTDRNQIAPFRHINKAQSIIDAMNETLPEKDRLDGFIFVVNDPIPEEIMDEVFSLPVKTALVSRLGGRGAHAADIAKSLGKVYVGQVRQIAKFSGRPETVRFAGLPVVVGSKMAVHGQTGEIALYPTDTEKDSD